VVETKKQNKLYTDAKYCAGNKNLKRNKISLQHKNLIQAIPKYRTISDEKA